MTIRPPVGITPLLRSALTLENRFQSLEEFHRWFEDCERRSPLLVEQIPFSDLQRWQRAPETGDLVHDSGKFFRVEGLHVATNFGTIPEWEQPIINQPEIGILGLIVKEFAGTYYCLVQAKMEPGNARLNQLCPTVQATKSNYTRVHAGRQPKYLEYFLALDKHKVIYDQLQSEQGGRFFRKRNRNIIIEVKEDLPLEEGFCWLTIGEIRELTKLDNFVNMEARTVLSCVPLIDSRLSLSPYSIVSISDLESMLSNIPLTPFGRALLRSLHSGEEESVCTHDALISWITGLKVHYELTTRYVPLNKVRSWIVTPNEIRHESGNFFSVIAVRAASGNREVQGWTQPLIAEYQHGLVGFLCQRQNGILHFLVCAKVEPGHQDIIELSPTVSCSEIARRRVDGRLPPFAEEFLDAIGNTRHISALQSEEGGRFYHFQNRYEVVEIEESRSLDVPTNYAWMTLRQIRTFMRYNNMFNIEARGVLACLRFTE